MTRNPAATLLVTMSCVFAWTPPCRAHEAATVDAAPGSPDAPPPAVAPAEAAPNVPATPVADPGVSGQALVGAGFEARAGSLAEAARAATFAESLFGAGDHYRAITEYKRALFLAPASVDAPRWSLRIGDALRMGGQYAAAGAAYDDSVRNYGTYVAGDAYLGGARAYLATDKHESALARAKSAAEWFASQPDRVREARFVEGWALMLANRDEEAAKAFEAAQGPGRAGEGATQLVKLLPQLKTLPHKDPVLAGALGFIPGLGHAYVGDPGSALAALLWNGVFGVAIWQAATQQQWSVAAVLIMFEAMWYGGSIIGAMTGAHRFNRDARLNAMEDLAKVASPELLDPVHVESAR